MTTTAWFYIISVFVASTMLLRLSWRGYKANEELAKSDLQVGQVLGKLRQEVIRKSAVTRSAIRAVKSKRHEDSIKLLIALNVQERGEGSHDPDD